MDGREKQALLAALHDLGQCTVRVEGRSMWPFIVPGDRVILISRQVTPKQGSVVAFFSGEQLILHRIIHAEKLETENWKLSIQGDSSLFSQATITWQECIGTATALIRGEKTIRWVFSLPFPLLSLFSKFLHSVLYLKMKIFRSP